jgi:chitodextrinase
MKKNLLKRRVSILAIFILFVSQFAFAQVPPETLNGEELKSWLRTNYYDGKHQTLGYTNARLYLYNYIDNENGVITCVYSGLEVNSAYGGTTTYPAPINCEHTIPQSYFGEADPMVSDIHHLYPSYENWNSTRSNYPFADIVDNVTAKWMYLDQSLTTIPTSNIDLYSEYANSTFEPREDHKGNVARSIFYFYTMYPTQAGDISLIGDINMFYEWHLADPVDALELERNSQVETYQGNRNPYIDYPEVIARAWGFSSAEVPPSSPTLQLNSSTTTITLTWNNVSDENGYKLYKSTNGSSYSLLSDIAANTTSYSDNAVAEGTTYYYYILAYNDFGNSSNSNVVSGQPNSGSTGTGISVSEALATSIGTAITVDGIITTSFNGVYALIMKDISGSETIVVKLEIDQRAEWNPENNPSAVGKTIEVVGVRDIYSSQASIEYVTSITEIGGSTEDTQAPTVPSSLAYSNVTTSSVNLSWTASTDNVGVTGYDVYRNGSYLASTTSVSYSVTGLSASTAYTFYVKAKDAAGNVSAASTTLNVTTSTPVDTQSPTVPTSLASSNVTETSVYLSWNASTDNVGVTGYDLYRNGSYLATTSNTTYSVTGLSASTTYTFYVKAKDAAGNISTASSTISVTTNDVVLSYCSSQGNNSTYEWIAQVSIGAFTNSSASAKYTDFTSKIISLESGTSVNVSLTPGFSSSTYNEYWKIWIDYNADGDFDDSGELAYDAGALSKTTVSGSINVPSSASGSTRMRVSMKYNAAQTACETFSYGEVEDYTATFTASVPDTQAPTIPVSLAASNVTSSSATISWTASTDNVGVTQYEVYRNGSFIGNSSTTNYAVSGLSASTTYSFTVKAKDAAGNISGFSNALNVTTSDIQLTYCSTKGSNVYYEWIDLVQIGSINNSTVANGGYADFTNLSTSLALGETVSINLSCGFKSTSYTEYWHVWIDWNQNGTFDSSEEMVKQSSSSSGTLTYSFTVPGDAITGSTRMRVTMKYNAVATPCETFSYGEVEDYTINVTATKSATIAAVNQDISFANLKVKLYPNPAESYTNIELISESNTTFEYKVIDIEGRVISTKRDIPVNGYQEEHVDISNLKSGIYFIMISNQQYKETFKLIVK